MLNVLLAGVNLYGKSLFTWVSLVMSLKGFFFFFFFLCCLFSQELSCMRSGTEFSQFLSC